MQISEKNLALTQLHPFGGLRLLNLYDHVARCKYLASGLQNPCARVAIIVVSRSDASACIGLDHHAVAGRYIFADGSRRQAYAVFLRLDLLGDTNFHFSISLLGRTFLIERAVCFPANLRSVAPAVFGKPTQDC